jgi:hypothetical protein
MKSHLIRIVVALVCFGSASALVARAAEHGLAFKDVSLGITLADFCAKYDRPLKVIRDELRRSFLVIYLLTRNPIRVGGPNVTTGRWGW